MSTTLDSQLLFDEGQLEIEIGTLTRDSIERAISGLDGVLSIDLGGRGRIVKHTGALRTQSRSEMNNRVSAISAFMDGKTHRLVTSSGEEFGNLRMDSFKVSKERVDGSGLCCDYEIVYRQLEGQQ